MKIVFICNEYPPVKAGGIGIFTKKLAEGLAKAGHDIYVVGIYWGIKSRIEETTNQVKVVRIPHSTGRFSLISNRIAIYENLKYISSVKQIDILETPDFEANTAYIPKLAKINITRLHGSHTYFSSERSVKPSTIIRHLEKRQLKLSSSIVSVSQYTAKETKRLFSLRDNPHVIYNIS